MNEIVKVFNEQPVRIIEENGTPWFVGKDVCQLLGYRNETDAMNRHCRGVVKRYPIVDSLGREQEARVLAESDEAISALAKEREIVLSILANQRNKLSISDATRPTCLSDRDCRG